jgi:hypothetical protein
MQVLIETNVVYSTIEKKILVGYKRVSKLHPDSALIYHISETEIAISSHNASAYLNKIA